MKQLELFPMKQEEAKDFLFRKGVNSLSGTVGGEVASYFRHVGEGIAEQYLFTRYATGEFMILDAELVVCTHSLVYAAHESYMENVFPNFFTSEEMDAIRALRETLKR